MDPSPLAPFSEPVRAWFETSFPEPTAAQAGAWGPIARGEHTLLCAPTGSGKTLAAFLSAIDVLGTEPSPEPGVRVIYVSPLRALAVDIEKNLRSPLRGISLAAQRLGASFVEPTVGVRTGDTSPSERRALVRSPPDILITTPESLYLMLTSAARETLVGVRSVIVDEIHALAPTKRGAHLALTLERLDHLIRTRNSTGPTASVPAAAPAAASDTVPAATRPAVQRIGLSATQRPLEVVAGFLGGPRQVTIVDAGMRKELDISVVVPVDDMGALGQPVAPPEGTEIGQLPLRGPQRASIWPSMHPELLALVESHHSTLVFVNARRLSERLASRLNELALEQRQEADPDGDARRRHSLRRRRGGGDQHDRG